LLSGIFILTAIEVAGHGLSKGSHNDETEISILASGIE
jgi:hypothetical protein